MPTECIELDDIENGQKTCHLSRLSNTSAITAGSECFFDCNKGFKLVGPSVRTCLPIAVWTGLTPFCKPVKCPRLRKPNFGKIYPAHCSTQESWYRGRCAFACDPGFMLQGPTLRECELQGTWSGGPQLTRCVGSCIIFLDMESIT